MQKATPVTPPEPTRNIVEVDMTQVYLYMGGLALSTAMVGVTSWIGLKLQRRNREHIEALSEYVSRLINETDCGEKAYESLLAEYEHDEEREDWDHLEEKTEDEAPVSWEEEDVFSPEDADEPGYDEPEPKIRVRRGARDIYPNV